MEVFFLPAAALEKVTVIITITTEKIGKVGCSFAEINGMASFIFV